MSPDFSVTYVPDRSDDGRIIVYRSPTGRISAARNRCKHQGGRFMPGEDEMVLTCGRHGWKLDVSSMAYVNPAHSGIIQDELEVEVGADGMVCVYEYIRAQPWEREPMSLEGLAPGEFAITFFAHACVEIRCGHERLFTDPWLTGPAFTRGWWLTQLPPLDWLDRLARASAIYISHSHSDRLNVRTLKLLAARAPGTPIYVPHFENRICEHRLKELGFTKVNSVPFGEWTRFGKKGRFMVLRDAAGRDDSGILIEYKGHKVLNTVDSSNLNDGLFPNPIDVLMTNFAGGASAYPVCWGDLYSEELITQMVLKNRQLLKVRIAANVHQAKPRAYIPFAGYFTEAHPADIQIRRLNVKNTPQEVCEFLGKYYPDLTMWVPEPGATFDLATLSAGPPPFKQPEKIPYDFAPYVEEIRTDGANALLEDFEEVKKYFRRAGFTGNLVLHIIETDETFARVLREFYVDFNDCSFPLSRPARGHRYLRMRVRSDVFRYVLGHKLSWEEITIGFQACFYREPDVYNFDFWNHFQNRLFESKPPL
jgi:CMP-N-acetylneuraminate monooxygenase